MEESMSGLEEITTALADLNEDGTLALVRKAIEDKVPPESLLQACQQGMEEIGRRFESCDYFVSDLIMSGEIFKQVAAILDPLLAAGSTGQMGKVVIGTVHGDIHDIGKDIVVNMLKSAGFEVIDLGVDVPAANFVAALKESGATVLGMSGLLTLAFDSMKETVNAVAAAGLRDKVRIMVGGGPVDGNVCKAVGADDWGKDAQRAVKLAKQWLLPAA
jgi:5-methyltetrahydrofolate--homocysteine methyltransferase